MSLFFHSFIHSFIHACMHACMHSFIQPSIQQQGSKQKITILRNLQLKTWLPFSLSNIPSGINKHEITESLSTQQLHPVSKLLSGNFGGLGDLGSLPLNFGGLVNRSFVRSSVRLSIRSFLRSIIIKQLIDSLICWVYIFQVFLGNTNMDTVVSHVFPQHLKARFVRIWPQTWRRHISLRAELYGCSL